MTKLYIKSDDMALIKRVLINNEISFEVVEIIDGVEKTVDKFVEEDYYRSSEDYEDYYDSGC